MPSPSLSRSFGKALVLLVLACTGAGAHQLNRDSEPMGRWREQIDNARRLAVPPPPKGVRDVQWEELSPRGWNPGKIMQRLGVSKVSATDPQYRDVETEILREWDRAPTVAIADTNPIRLTGYSIILGEGQGLVKTIILVPYHGHGIHRPPAPANQRVMVSLKHGLPRNMGETPIWVTGQIHPLGAPTLAGWVGYTMTDATWQKFPVSQYPLPRYNPLH